MSISIIWLLAGAVMVALEAMAVPGIGFLFAGLGAIVTGIVIEMGLAEAGSYAAQAAWFCGSTALWAAALWKPLKKFRLGKNGTEYSNIVGTLAVVHGEPMRKGAPGKVMWSGTLMQARLAPQSHDEIAAGTEVKIVAVEGNTLIVES